MLIPTLMECQTIGEQYNATAGQVALAWLLACDNAIPIPIPGTMKEKVSRKVGILVANSDLDCLWHLKENLGTLDLRLRQKEVDDVWETINKADATGGKRYLPILMDTLFANTLPLED